MKNFKYWLGLAFMGWASHAFAQNETDALRYSQTRFGGTARTLGIGGANVALGADLGNLSSNPAGLGLFQKSELSFTPGLGLGQTNTQALGADNKTAESRNSLHVGSFGVAFTTRRPDDDNSSDWRGHTLAFGFTRLNDFNARFQYSNTVAENHSLFERLRNPTKVDGSLTGAYDDIDKQYKANEYTSLDGLAYAAYLTAFYTKKRPANPQDLDSLSTIRRTGPILQNELVQTTGSQNQYDFGYGASYRDKLYIGASLGLTSLRYQENRTYQETEANDPNNTTPFLSLSRHDQVETTGSGFNLKVGAIYRVLDAVRIGASVQTPTFMRLTDTYSTTLDTKFSSSPQAGVTATSASVKTLPSEYSYSLTTPFRASGGAAVTLSKHGFITGDVEYVNYSQARLGGDTQTNNTYTFDQENGNVKAQYHSALNLRVGGEARFDIFRLRLGYAHYGDPFKASDFDRTQQYFTGGIGLRQQGFFLDVAGVYGMSKSYSQSYAYGPVIGVDGTRFTTSVTFGTTF